MIQETTEQTETRAKAEAKEKRPPSPYVMMDKEWQDGYVSGVLSERKKYLRDQCPSQ